MYPVIFYLFLFSLVALFHFSTRLFLLLFENESARLFIHLAKLGVFLFALFLGFFDYLIYLRKLNRDLFGSVENVVYAFLSVYLVFFLICSLAGAFAFEAVNFILIHIKALKLCPAQ